MKKRNDNLKILEKHLTTFWYAPCDALLRAYETIIWKDLNFISPILDIGIGDGRFDNLLFVGKKIDFGIDPDCRMIKYAKRLKLFRKVICESAEKMSFKSSSINTVISNSTFEHIIDDVSAVKEVGRVLRKNGYFIFSVPTLNFPLNLKRSGLNNKEIKAFDKRVVHRHYRDISEWKKILNESGLTIKSSFTYFDNNLFNLWWKFFKITNFKPYHRELWSYLKDSPYGRLVPKRILIYIWLKMAKSIFENSIGKEGCWAFIIAQKK